MAESAVPEIYVQPGESHLSHAPVIFRTVLGSCVGVTFLIPRLGVGAICHAMLPRYPENLPGGMSIAMGCRYVDFSLRDLARQFDALGARRAEVRVKLFGGGDVLEVNPDSVRPTVGRMNREVAMQVLAEEGFSIAASSLGGTSGLNIQFHTGTGEVLLRRLGSGGERQVSRVKDRQGLMPPGA
jgi:chemotaxis protein CheD